MKTLHIPPIQDYRNLVIQMFLYNFCTFGPNLTRAAHEIAIPSHPIQTLLLIQPHT